MRNLVSVFVAFGFALSLALAVPAMAAERTAPVAPSKADPAAPMKKMAPKVHQLTGMVEAIDAAAGTFTVKGRRGSASLKAGEKVSLDAIAVGEKVYVRYTDGTALSVMKVHARMKRSDPAAPSAPAEKK